MSALTLTRDALNSSAFTSHQKEVFGEFLLTVLPEALVAGSGITITADEDEGTLTFVATVSSSIGKHAVPVMAPAILPKQTSGCASLAHLTGASGQPDVAYLAFDSSSAEYAQFALSMPSSWDEGTITFVPHWTHPATTTNFGVAWSLRAVAVSNDDTLVVSFGTPQTSIDTGGTTSDYYSGPESSAITIAGTPAAGDWVVFEISRQPSNGSDTMAVDAYLLGFTIFITTAATVDA